MIPIGSIDWNAIRAEYIGGGTSYRKLAKKYGVSINVLSPRAAVEGWVNMRKEAETKATAKALQKTANIAADNATIAARIRTKLLLKLEKEIDKLPDLIGSEHSTGIVEYGKNQNTGAKQRKEVVTAYKLRDLSAAYKDLTADMATGDTAKNDLMRDFVEASKRRLGNG